MNEDLLDGFTIGPYRILPREETIVGPDSSHHVEPKVMQVLVTLAANAGKTVTRNDILEEVWSDSIVGDEVLSRAISLLRGYFQDERTQPKYIRTVPRRGYELIAPVQLGAVPSPPARKLPWRSAAAAAVALLAIAAIWLWPDGAADDVTIAVMPLTVTGEETELAYMAEGLADHLITHLTRSPELNVVARRSSFLIRDTDANVRAIGESLGAQYIVEGSLADRDGSALLTLYIVDTESGTNAWTTQIKGSPGDFTTLQRDAERELNQALANNLGIELGDSQATPTVPEDALMKYHEASYQWSLRGEPRIARAIALLQEAIELAPDFAAAHMALAQTVAVKPFYSDDPVAQQFTLARASAAKALELDPSLAADVAALEGFLLYSERRWREAEASLKHALELDPNHIYGHYWYSSLLAQLGQYDQALMHIETAWRLNPVSAVFNDRLAVTYLWVNNNQAAAERYQAAADLGYLTSTQPLSFILFLIRAGRFDEVEALWLRMGYPESWVTPVVRGFEDPTARAEATLAVEDARKAGSIPFGILFGIWVMYEDADRAFRDFDSSLKTPYVEFLWTSEAEFLRNDPRFSALLQSVNLADLVDARGVRKS